MDFSKKRRRAAGSQRRDNCAAFTLVEVVLAVAIAIGILVVALYFYQQASHLRGQLLDETERISTVRLVMDRITAELRTAPGRTPFQRPLTGDSNFIQFVRTDLPALADWTGGALGRASSPETDLKMITYRLESSDGTNTSGLLRSEEPLVGTRKIEIVDTISLVETNLPSGAGALPLSEAIRFVQFRYWNGSAWQEAWNLDELPKGVEVSLGFEAPAPEGETNAYPAAVFRRIIYLPGGSPESLSLVSSNTPAVTGATLEEAP